MADQRHAPDRRDHAGEHAAGLHPVVMPDAVERQADLDEQEESVHLQGVAFALARLPDLVGLGSHVNWWG